MTIRFKCAQCGRTFQTPDEAAGKKAPCPGCGTMLKVPGRAQAVTETGAVAGLSGSSKSGKYKMPMVWAGIAAFAILLGVGIGVGVHMARKTEPAKAPENPAKPVARGTETPAVPAPEPKPTPVPAEAAKPQPAPKPEPAPVPVPAPVLRPAPPKTDLSVPLAGLEALMFGMTPAQVVAILGKPDEISMAENSYRYYSRGVACTFDENDQHLRDVRSQNTDASFKDHPFTGRTTAGIGIGASVEDVRLVYGQPDWVSSSSKPAFLAYRDQLLKFHMRDSKVVDVTSRYLKDRLIAVTLQGTGGVKLGMTMRELHAALGVVDGKARVSFPALGLECICVEDVLELRWSSKKWMEATVKTYSVANWVNATVTTPEGIRLGSTEKEVRDAYGTKVKGMTDTKSSGRRRLAMPERHMAFELIDGVVESMVVYTPDRYKTRPEGFKSDEGPADRIFQDALDEFNKLRSGKDRAATMAAFEEAFSLAETPKDGIMLLEGLAHDQRVHWEYDSALATCSRALALPGITPANMSILLEEMGNVQLMTGKAEAGREIFEKISAMEEAPAYERVRALMSIATSYAGDGQYEKAHETYARINSASYASTGDRLHALSDEACWFRNEKKYDLASATLRKGLALPGISRNDKNNLIGLSAEIYRDQNLPDEAIKLLKEAADDPTAADGDKATALMQLGDFYLSLHDYSHAKPVYQKIVDLGTKARIHGPAASAKQKIEEIERKAGGGK